MPEKSAVESTRRHLSGKRADTVQRLSRATVEVLREVGYHDLTLQAVAARAGTALTTRAAAATMIAFSIRILVP